MFETNGWRIKNRRTRFIIRWRQRPPERSMVRFLPKQHLFELKLISTTLSLSFPWHPLGRNRVWGGSLACLVCSASSACIRRLYVCRLGLPPSYFSASSLSPWSTQSLAVVTYSGVLDSPSVLIREYRWESVYMLIDWLQFFVFLICLFMFLYHFLQTFFKSCRINSFFSCKIFYW